MRTITVGRGKYKTIADLPYPLPYGTRVVIRAGIYNEQLVLSSGCRYELDRDAIIDYSADNALPTISVWGQKIVDCYVGGGTIRRSGINGAASIAVIGNGSSVTIESDLVGENPCYNAAVELNGATLNFKGSIAAKSCCIRTSAYEASNLIADGIFSSVQDYCIWIANQYTLANVKGSIYSKGNSAICFSAGTFTIESAAIISDGYFGLEIEGEGDVLVRNSIIESRVNGGYQVGDAVSHYVPSARLTFDNCTFKCAHPNAYSISEQGYPARVTFASDCRGTNQVSPLIGIDGPGSLVVG